MKNTNLNNTIKFIDKKAEYKERKHYSHLDIKKLKNKKNIIIGYEEHKKNKALREKKEKIKKSKIYKSRKKILQGSIVIFCLFILFFLWTKFIQPSMSTATNKNSFQVESQSLSKSEMSTYSSIIKKSVDSALGVNYKITVEQLHRNGNLIFGTGYFTIPDEGNVNYDIILKDYTPYSLKINGDEYIK